MKQISIKIGDIDVPVMVDENGEEWFPVSYITIKLLLRNGKNSMLNKHKREKYSSNLIKSVVNFSDNNTQKTTCIHADALKEILTKSHVGRLNVEQRKAQNKLHEYLGIELLPTDQQDTEYYLNEWKKEIDEYTSDIIDAVSQNEKIKYYRMCSKCNKHYPLTYTFFPVHNSADKGFSKICKMCDKGWSQFIHPDEDKSKLIKNDYELYEALNSNDIMLIYNSYVNGKITQLPRCYQNKESFMRIIKNLYHSGVLNEKKLFMGYLTKQMKLINASVYLTITEIYIELFGENFYHYIWKYPKYTFREIKLTYEIANNILRNYIREHGIVIQDIFSFDYTKLITQCKIRKLVERDGGYFIVQFFNHKYPYYKFKNNSPNYYKEERNLLHDLKYLIETDLNIDINKIPLYLTKMTLQRKCKPLYHYIVTNKNGSIFEWVNKLYPNKFIETDFEINAYREQFGSDEECFIHEVLRENFNNVIYNQIHTSRTIEIDGMIPDWIILTNTGGLIVEYFGLYIERQYGNNTRVTEYIDKTHKKIEKYKQIKGYRYLFLYPDDLNDNYKGVRQKIAKLQGNVDLSMV